VKKAFSVLLLFLLAACETTSYVADTVLLNGGRAIKLSTPQKDLGSKIKVYSIPVKMEQPKDALLSIDFKVVSTGHCSTSYEPTVLYLNDHEITEFDFRDYFVEKQIKKELKLSEDQFKVGLNTLRIETGACDFDIDVLDLNGLKLIY
jgi:hypothetical protein